MKNFAIKREQNQACLSYAEREQNRRVASMKSEEFWVGFALEMKLKIMV